MNQGWQRFSWRSCRFEMLERSELACEGDSVGIGCGAVLGDCWCACNGGMQLAE